MSKRHRNRARAPRPTTVTTKPSASWNWSGGVSSDSGFDGSKIRGALRNAYPSGYDLDSSACRSRSRMAFWDSPQARGLLSRIVDNTIGTGLILRSTPAWNLIGATLSFEDRRKLANSIDEHFRLWADSHEPDSTGRRNFAELQSFALLNELKDGDQPIILRYLPDSRRTSPLALQFLDADQLDMRQTTYGHPKTAGLALEVQGRGNVLKDGIEMTSSGELVAIYVLDPAKPFGDPVRVPVWGSSSDRRFVLLPAILDLPGQVRGVGPLAAVVHELQKIADYGLAELEAAVVNAIIAGYITTEVGGERKGNLSGVRTAGQADTTGASSDVTPRQVDYTQGGVWVQNLGKGQDIKSFDTARPNVNFAGFVDAQMESISASLSMPVEVWKEKFSQNYSASRASLILFWETILRWRIHFISQVAGPVYEAWLREEVKLGRFPILTATGFGTDPIVTRAWLQAEWVGDSMPSIDPLKEAQADDLRIAQGATTRERVALKYDKSDFYENAERQTAEEKVLPRNPDAATRARETVPPSDDPEQDQPAKESDK